MEQVKSSVKFTAPVIKKDEEVKAEDEIQLEEVEKSTKAVGAFNVQGNDEVQAVRRLLKVLTALLHHAAHAIFRFKRLCFQKRERLCLRAARQEDPDRCGYTPCILDSGADHADLTDEYAAIPQEMRSVARCFGKEVLREVNEAEFYAQLKQVRAQTGDRAVLRAMHFFDENRRVLEQVQALKNGDFEGFLAGVRDSGRSSWMLLQNIIPLGSTAHQQMALAQALCEKLLGGRGACRVHGGGFAGTILAFVPDEMLEQFWLFRRWSA